MYALKTAPQTDTITFADAANGPGGMVLKRINRHGLIAGATGTGKTVTLQTLTEQMALAGIPCLAVDIKGDLSGIGVGKNGAPAPVPVQFWDVFGKDGIPIRTTISEFGPILLSRLFNLSDAQSGVLQILFRLADEQDLLLIDLRDLKATLHYMAENIDAIGKEYGLVAPQSIAAIQREILIFENQGGAALFGEPPIYLPDMMATTPDGRGMVNILAANVLYQQPAVYASLLLYILSELFENMPEAGDLPKPHFVLFLDEAHLLFTDTPDVLVDKIEQVVRLIRSKGVGIYFITQNPLDIPEKILAQLGNRFQHALRAFTPKEQKAVKTAAETFRANPALDTATVITQLGIGEALVSTLDAAGVPTMVEKMKIRLPQSNLGAIAVSERTRLNANPLGDKYRATVDSQSAFEKLQVAQQTAPAAPTTSKPLWGSAAPTPRASAQNTNNNSVANGLVNAVFGGGNSRRQGMGEALVKSVVRSAGSTIGRQIVRGILGSVLK